MGLAEILLIHITTALGGAVILGLAARYLDRNVLPTVVASLLLTPLVGILVLLVTPGGAARRRDG